MNLEYENLVFNESRGLHVEGFQFAPPSAIEFEIVFHLH